MKIRSVYRFGEITLITQDGLPKQILKTIKRDLMSDGYPQVDMTQSVSGDTIPATEGSIEKS